MKMTKDEIKNLLNNPDVSLVIGKRDYMKEALSDLLELHNAIEESYYRSVIKQFLEEERVK